MVFQLTREGCLTDSLDPRGGRMHTDPTSSPIVELLAEPKNDLEKIVRRAGLLMAANGFELGEKSVEIVCGVWARGASTVFFHAAASETDTVTATVYGRHPIHKYRLEGHVGWCTKLLAGLGYLGVAISCLR